MRRLILIAGLWLGLLGVVQPLLACAMNPSLSNCCPAGIDVPCDPSSDQTGAADQSTACCATAPVQNPTLVALGSKDAHLAQVTGNPSDGHCVAPPFSEPVFIPDKFSLTSRVPIHHPACSGTDTYLRTGRLRL